MISRSFLGHIRNPKETWDTQNIIFKKKSERKNFIRVSYRSVSVGLCQKIQVPGTENSSLKLEVSAQTALHKGCPVLHKSPLATWSQESLHKAPNWQLIGTVNFHWHQTGQKVSWMDGHTEKTWWSTAQKHPCGCGLSCHHTGNQQGAKGLGRAGWSPQGSSVPHVRLCSMQLKGLVSSCEANPWADGTRLRVFCTVYPEPWSTAWS